MSITLPAAITPKGDTVVKPFYLVDDLTPVNLATTYTNITAWLVDSAATVVQKYSRETLTDHNTADFYQLTQSGATLGKFEIKLQAAVTLAAAEGQYYWLVKVFATDADFLNGIAKESFKITHEDGQVLQFKEYPNATL